MTFLHKLVRPVVFLAWLVSACGDPAPYLRAVDDESGGRVLQIASRTLVSPQTNGPSVTLLGVSHLGEASYYGKIQKRLDSADLVLFEGVGFGDKSQKKDAGNSNAVSEMQLSLSRSMGLVFQLQAIRYDRAHFRNSDISSEALMTRLKGGPLKTGRDGKTESEEKSKDGAERSKELMEAGIPAGPVYDLGQMFNDPQVQHQGMVETITHPVIGDLAQLSNPLRLGEVGPKTVRIPPPALGEHSAEVLADWGLATDRIDSLIAGGHVQPAK